MSAGNQKELVSPLNMAMETAMLAAHEPCLALSHMQEYDTVKKNNEASGFITKDQVDTLFE